VFNARAIIQHMAETATATKKREKRTYSKEYIANALNVVTAHGGNVLAASKDLGVPRLTLREWVMNGRRVDTEVQTIQREKAPELADLYEDTSRLYLDHARHPAVISASTGLESIKSAAICTDKSQLLRGEPTSIMASVDRQELSVTLNLALAELDETGNGDPLGQAKNITPELASFGRSGPQDIAVFQE
jgi:hypothetical protein